MNPPFPIHAEKLASRSSNLEMHSAAFYSMEVEFLRILFWVIQARRYQSIVEIGVANGNASWWLYESIKGMPDLAARYYLVDPSLDTKAITSLLRPTIAVRMYRENSASFFEISEKDKRFDLILIDGSHAYMDCMRDFDYSIQALSEGGMIAIHDVHYEEGCVRAAEELQKKYEGTWMNYPCGKGLTLYEPTKQWEAR